MILVTGGAGHIGSHTCVKLIKADHKVTVFDNFCNSQPEALARVERITGKKPMMFRGDLAPKRRQCGDSFCGPQVGG
jgi:UDP-glucose 4-epimerase